MAGRAWCRFGVWMAASLSALALASSAQAERPLPEARIESARGMALGTGARASAASTQAQADNPANLAVGGLYHIEGFMGYQPSLHRMGVGAAIVDSMTSRVAAGASARMLFGDNSAGKNAGWEGRVSLAAPLADIFSLGIAGRYFRYTLSDPNAKPEHSVKAGQKPDQTYQLNAFTMDASMTLRPIPGLAISALGYNLVDTKSTIAPLMVGGSASVGFGGGFSLGGDALVDLNTHKAFNGPKLITGGGAEYLLQGTVPLRVGYQFDQGRAQHAVTGGIGFVDQHVGVQFSLRQIVAGGSETTLMGALQYFVQ